MTSLNTDIAAIVADTFDYLHLRAYNCPVCSYLGRQGVEVEHRVIKGEGSSEFSDEPQMRRRPDGLYRLDLPHFTEYAFGIKHTETCYFLVEIPADATYKSTPDEDDSYDDVYEYEYDYTNWFYHGQRYGDDAHHDCYGSFDPEAECDYNLGFDCDEPSHDHEMSYFEAEDAARAEIRSFRGETEPYDDSPYNGGRRTYVSRNFDHTELEAHQEAKDHRFFRRYRTVRHHQRRRRLVAAKHYQGVVPHRNAWVLNRGERRNNERTRGTRRQIQFELQFELQLMTQEREEDRREAAEQDAVYAADYVSSLLDLDDSYEDWEDANLDEPQEPDTVTTAFEDYYWFNFCDDLI